MATERTARAADARDGETRAAEEINWRPPSLLPDPDPRPGYVHRWVRYGLAGAMDSKNVSERRREYWEPCKIEDYPEFGHMVMDHGDKASGNIEIGGLVLCRMPERIAAQRQAYYDRLNRNQISAIDDQLKKEENPVMPMLAERATSFSERQ